MASKALRYGIPNSITAASLLLGLGSIVTGMFGDLELAGWMIVWCGLLDVMDGLAARLLKAESNFGAEFDSMADLVAFGVAPGMLMLKACMQLGGIVVGSHAFLVLLLAGASRLARFNLLTGAPSTGWFAGIPITVAGGAMLSTAVILLAKNPDLAGALPLHAYLPILLFVMALGMVSTLRFPKFRRRESALINGFQGFNFVATYYCGITRSYPEFLFFMGLFLLISGLIAGRMSRYNEPT